MGSKATRLLQRLPAADFTCKLSGSDLELRRLCGTQNRESGRLALQRGELTESPVKCGTGSAECLLRRVTSGLIGVLRKCHFEVIGILTTPRRLLLLISDMTPHEFVITSSALILFWWVRIPGETHRLENCRGQLSTTKQAM